MVMLRYAVWKKGLGAWRDGRDRWVGTALYRRSQVFWAQTGIIALFCIVTYGMVC